MILALFLCEADAFTTRAHIAIANDLRQALIASGEGRIALKGSGHAVQLSEADAAAIIDNPLTFRAGAIGPDNFSFPAMTDPTHALGTNPFGQCESLYQAALTPDEVAYALGCLVHGSGDLAAHHAVNWLTGETFTLTPLFTERQDSFHNVVRHIVAESMIQQAMHDARPGIFDEGSMLHSIPLSLILRTYMDGESEAFQLASTHARHKLDVARERTPKATMSELAQTAGLGPAEQLVLVPLYLGEIDALVSGLADDLQARLGVLQDGTTRDGRELGVGAGPDGALGTLDDTTACTTGCVTLYAEYFATIGLLAPRADAGGNALPSALDDIAGELRDDLFTFKAAYVQTIGIVSGLLNRAYVPGAPPVELSPAELDQAMAPMDAWIDDVTGIDFDTLASQAAPVWLQELNALFSAVGIPLNLGGILQGFLQPLIDEVETTVRTLVLVHVDEFLGDLVEAIEEDEATVEAEYLLRLEAVSPEGIDGTILDHIDGTGLMMASFNLAAAALAERQLLQSTPHNDHDRAGPASFDASHGMSWSKAAACPHLTAAIFPMGEDLAGLLSVMNDDGTHRANTEENAPNECHDGQLDRFADDPSAAECMLVDLGELLDDKVGSLSRAFSPTAVAAIPPCEDLIVPGLPEPVSVALATVPRGGCGCSQGSPLIPLSGASPLPLSGGLSMLWVLGLVAARRRPWVAAALLLSACTNKPDPSTVDTKTKTTTETTPQVDLLDQLGTEVWHGTAMREGFERAVEQHFRANDRLWAEVVNPFGPSFHREMRVFGVEDDNLTLTTTVTLPALWPVDPEVGREDTWTVAVTGDTLTLERDGIIETYERGPWPAPASGLTAHVRVFRAGGRVDDAFCDSGIGGFDYNAVFDFARGEGEAPDAEDVVVGVDIGNWRDLTGNNQFAVRDVLGFDRDGGTTLTNQYNFVVTYTGDVTLPAGAFSMREQDDSVEDAIWVFLGNDVGSNNTNDLFLEVHGFVWADSTPDAPTTTVQAGKTAIEALFVRCTEAITPVDLDVNVGGAGWDPASFLETSSPVDNALFPAPF